MTRVSGLWAVAVVVTGWSLVAGGCSALTECGGDGDCEANYRCDATAKRCVASYGTDAECDVGQRCNAGLCEGGAGSSGGGGSHNPSNWPY